MKYFILINKNLNIKFQCPYCKEPLPGEELKCRLHGEFKRTSKGFISFLSVQDCYFSDHWSLNPLSEIPSAKTRVAKRFLEPILDFVSGTWLDVGVGDGVHLHLLSSESKQTQLIGLDISADALAICHKRIPEATLILADAETIPIRSESLDGVFSYGVLAYVPDTWSALAEMIRVTRKGGLVGIWIFPKTNSFMGTIFSFVRSTVPRLPRYMQSRIADCIVPLLGLLPTTSRVHLGNASWAACREVVMVNIAPPFLNFLVAEEVRQKFQALGCRIVAEDSLHPITLWGIKE